MKNILKQIQWNTKQNYMQYQNTLACSCNLCYATREERAAEAARTSPRGARPRPDEQAAGEGVHLEADVLEQLAEVVVEGSLRQVQRVPGLQVFLHLRAERPEALVF